MAHVLVPVRPGAQAPPLEEALAGAILTTVLIWGATKVLAILFADFSRYNVIYGSLAGVMTFLFYVYVVALVFLLGAEFAHAWSQGPGPPGPPIGARTIHRVLRGLFVHHDRKGAARRRVARSR